MRTNEKRPISKLSPSGQRHRGTALEPTAGDLDAVLRAQILDGHRRTEPNQGVPPRQRRVRNRDVAFGRAPDDRFVAGERKGLGYPYAGDEQKAGFVFFVTTTAMAACRRAGGCGACAGHDRSLPQRGSFVTLV